jgi:hypothetical protein
LYRHAYLYFTLAFVVTMVGFWPSFFSNPGQNDLTHALHGSLATAWMLMLIAQSWLIAHRRVVWHRRVGKASYVLAPTFILSSALAVRVMLADPHGLPHPLRMSLAFLDICSLIAFAVLYGLAIWNHKSVTLHARYMSATVLIVVIPALGRFFAIYVPGVHGLNGALNPCFWVVDAACLALMLADRRAGRSLTPYAVTLAFLVAVNWGLWQAPGSAGFQALAHAAGMPA